MSKQHITDESDYDEACRIHATNQGLDPIINILELAGLPVDLLQTGGFCMVVAVGDIWITDEDGDCLIGSEDADDTDDYVTVPLGDLVATVRSRMA